MNETCDDDRDVNPSPPLIRARGLDKLYPDGRVHALKGVDLTVPRGQRLAIVGPSGGGKSTLLNLLGALDSPTRGTIELDGQPLDATNLDAIRARRIGFVFQSFHLLPTLTALENVQIPLFETLNDRRRRVAKARDLLEQVGLADRANALPGQLSSGERQRVALARALVNDPCLILADEPTGNLDSANAELVLSILESLVRERRATLVVVTHDLEIAARFERIVTLRDGRLVADQTRGQSDSPFPCPLSHPGLVRDGSDDCILSSPSNPTRDPSRSPAWATPRPPRQPA